MSTSSTLPKIIQSIPEALLALAPIRLPNHRKHRYMADDLCVRLDGLAAADQTLLRGLYQRLSDLLYTIADTKTTDAQKWAGIQSWIDLHNLDLVIDEVREIGFASHEQTPGESLAKAMHDVRGGALSALLGRLQLLGRIAHRPENLKIIFVQVRDHLKIMRSAVIGLDESRRKADRQPKAHAMQLMLDKWHESVAGPQWQEQPIRMKIDCRYEGSLTECCLESAAIDRIFYNLAANACRYTADEQLELTIFPISASPESDCLRFVFSNQVSEADATRLREMAQTSRPDGAQLGSGQSLVALFEPGVSATGSGFGLTVVADFVTGAFGLRDNAEALGRRYVGATLDGRTFRVWFHWPQAHEDLPPKTDDYHRPRESLSEP